MVVHPSCGGAPDRDGKLEWGMSSIPICWGRTVGYTYDSEESTHRDSTLCPRGRPKGCEIKTPGLFYHTGRLP